MTNSEIKIFQVDEGNTDIAVSIPEDKETIKKVIVNLIKRNN